MKKALFSYKGKNKNLKIAIKSREHVIKKSKLDKFLTSFNRLGGIYN